MIVDNCCETCFSTSESLTCQESHMRNNISSIYRNGTILHSSQPYQGLVWEHFNLDTANKKIICKVCKVELQWTYEEKACQTVEQNSVFLMFVIICKPHATIKTKLK